MTLELQHCSRCDHVQYYPRTTCVRCGSTELALRPAAGTGRLYSYTVVRRAPSPDVAVPYVVAVVRLDEGPALLTHVVECPIGELRCDLPVELRWQPTPDGPALAVFAPMDPEVRSPERNRNPHDG